MRAPATARLGVLAPLGLLLAALVALQLGDPEPGLLYLAPALLLLAALACGRYPGERLLDALIRRRAPRAWREARPAPRRRHPPRSFPRGGALIALALAGRGPPGRGA